jgi:hypothetical protein
MYTQIWDEIIDSLRGTCDTLYSALEYYNALYLEDNLQFLQYLDNQIFLCDACGWWCEISEESGVSDTEFICYDCAREHGYGE